MALLPRNRGFESIQLRESLDVFDVNLVILIEPVSLANEIYLHELTRPVCRPKAK